MDSMNDESIDNIITNLKIIGMIKVDEKLCIRKGHLQIDNSSNFQFLKRWFYRDSRDFILLFLKDLIRSIKNAFDKMYNYTDHLWMIKMLIQEMENAKTGLLNLKTTYSSDSLMIVKFEHVSIKFCELIDHIKLKEF
jgi:hypothetical protein